MPRRLCRQGQCNGEKLMSEQEYQSHCREEHKKDVVSLTVKGVAYSFHLLKVSGKDKYMCQCGLNTCDLKKGYSDASGLKRAISKGRESKKWCFELAYEAKFAPPVVLEKKNDAEMSIMSTQTNLQARALQHTRGIASEQAISTASTSTFGRLCPGELVDANHAQFKMLHTYYPWVLLLYEPILKILTDANDEPYHVYQDHGGKHHAVQNQETVDRYAKYITQAAVSLIIYAKDEKGHGVVPDCFDAMNIIFGMTKNIDDAVGLELPPAEDDKYEYDEDPYDTDSEDVYDKLARDEKKNLADIARKVLNALVQEVIAESGQYHLLVRYAFFSCIKRNADGKFSLIHEARMSHGFAALVKLCVWMDVSTGNVQSERWRTTLDMKFPMAVLSSYLKAAKKVSGAVIVERIIWNLGYFNLTLLSRDGSFRCSTSANQLGALTNRLYSKTVDCFASVLDTSSQNIREFRARAVRNDTDNLVVLQDSFPLLDVTSGSVFDSKFALLVKNLALLTWLSIGVGYRAREFLSIILYRSSNNSRGISAFNHMQVIYLMLHPEYRKQVNYTQRPNTLIACVPEHVTRLLLLFIAAIRPLAGLAYQESNDGNRDPGNLFFLGTCSCPHPSCPCH